MTNVNISNLFNFLLLLSIFYEIRSFCESTYNDKQRKIATKSRLKNNSADAPESVITAVITKPGEELVNGEHRNLTKLSFKFREKLHTFVTTGAKRRKLFQRQIHSAGNKTIELDGLECLSCSGNGVTIKDENCYRGLSADTEKCTYGKECYTELRTQSIWRGCISKNRMNRTFACKCALCNDKPSDDHSYYKYDNVRDWEYDNKRLEKPVLGMDLICKVCETKGINIVSDRTCRHGKLADYMVCGKNQVCFTNIDDETSFVSRGCTDKPANNSFYKFCDKTLCNSNSFENPRTRMLELVTRSSVGILVSNSSNQVGFDTVLLFFCFVKKYM